MSAPAVHQRIRLELPKVKRQHVWKLIQFLCLTVSNKTKDRRGIALAFIVPFLLGALTIFAFLVDVTAALIRRQEFLTMVELGTAAGGRIAAETIASVANQQIERGDVAPPTEEERQHPEKFLTAEQRNTIQNDPSLIAAVEAMTRDYIVKNQPAVSTAFDMSTELEIVYPEQFNDCSDPTRKSIAVQAIITHNYPFIMGKLALFFGSAEHISLQAIGRYTVPLCP